MRHSGLAIAVVLAVAAFCLAQQPGPPTEPQTTLTVEARQPATPPPTVIPAPEARLPHARPTTPQKWEYKEIHTSVEYLNIDEFNEAGKKGWELCTSQRQGETSFYIFKRPIVEQMIPASASGKTKEPTLADPDHDPAAIRTRIEARLRRTPDDPFEPSRKKTERPSER